MPPAPIELLGPVRTKIVATLGPRSSDAAMIEALIRAGVDVFRLNFSHGSHAEHTETLRLIRRISAQLGRVIGVLQDLCGPKIRLGPIAGEEVICNLGEAFTLAAEAPGDSPRVLTCSYPALADDLSVGDEVLFADGTVAMKVVATAPGRATLEVTLPGRLRSRQGINLPGSNLRVDSLTEADLAALDWSRENPVDFIGLSFVRSAEDVRRLRREMEARGLAAAIIAKIEKPQAVANLEAILGATDAVMVARGDLGVELDVARVPGVQKRIIAACNRAQVPVITATQMLTSMEHSNRPTRAEASDVYNAVLDGTDAVMLSGETAIGDYPVETVAMMNRIVAEAEAEMAQPNVPTNGLSPRAGQEGWITPVTDAIVESSSLVCRRLKPRVLVVATHTGRTALAVSKHRHRTPTLAVTDDPTIARRMSLYWGVIPALLPELTSPRQAMTQARQWAAAHDMVSPGDWIVLLAGTIPGSPMHNALLVQQVD